MREVIRFWALLLLHSALSRDFSFLWPKLDLAFEFIPSQAYSPRDDLSHAPYFQTQIARRIPNSGAWKTSTREAGHVRQFNGCSIYGHSMFLGWGNLDTAVKMTDSKADKIKLCQLTGFQAYWESRYFMIIIMWKILNSPFLASGAMKSSFQNIWLHLIFQYPLFWVYSCFAIQCNVSTFRCTCATSKSAFIHFEFSFRP